MINLGHFYQSEANCHNIKSYSDLGVGIVEGDTTELQEISSPCRLSADAYFKPRSCMQQCVQCQ